MSNSGNQNLKIIFLGAYHQSATPVQFKYALGLNNLLLNREELQRLVANYVQRHITLGSPLFNITEDIQEAILNFTGGHPGLYRFILSQLRIHYREFLGDETKEKILQYLASSKLRNSLTSSRRAFHCILDWTPSNEEIEFIRFVLLISHSRPLSVDYDSNPVARRFFKAGILAETDNKIQFTAPIIRIILTHRLFTNPMRKPAITFEEFLEKSIHRITHRRGNLSSPLYERSWQMEWYRACTTVVPENESISADVGPVFGSASFLDFYVNGNCCQGIELTCEGSLLKKYAERFESGVYITKFH